MVQFVSWFGVAIIGLFATVGFLGVVATSLLTAVRALRHTAPGGSVEPVESPHYASVA
jgi:hypothetical protein